MLFRSLDRTRARIGQQIEPDGRMPHELGRTCSFGYTLMNTRGFVDLAWLGRRLGAGLWAHASPDGRSIPAAVDFLYRQACADAGWPFQQIEPIDWRMIAPVLDRARALAGGGYATAALAHRLPPDFDAAHFTLIEPIHPFGQERSPAPAATHAAAAAARER